MYTTPTHPLFAFPQLPTSLTIWTFDFFFLLTWLVIFGICLMYNYLYLHSLSWASSYSDTAESGNLKSHISGLNYYIHLVIISTVFTLDMESILCKKKFNQSTLPAKSEYSIVRWMCHLTGYFVYSLTKWEISKALPHLPKKMVDVDGDTAERCGQTLPSVAQ